MEEQNSIDVKRLFTGHYCVRNNCLSMKVFVKNKSEPDYKLLCNFVPYIVRQIVIESGEEEKGLKLVIGGIDVNGRPLSEITVKDCDVANLDWVRTQWGCENRVMVNAKQYFLDALYSTATKENKSVHYAVTGWRKIDGEQRFLMPGDEDYSVDLDGKLKNYHLSHEIASPFDLQVLTKLLDENFAPHEVILPLLALMFMSPLHSFMSEVGCEPKLVLMLVGRSGSLKSTLAALMLSFFGKFTSTSLPFSFKDTANSILYHSHSLKDVPTVIDDYHPSVKGDEKDMTSAAQVIMRGWGNRSGRGRLNSSCSPDEEKHPRGDVLITAEFAPDVGMSGVARLFSVEMAPGAVDLERLSYFQNEALKETFQRCMYTYIEWLKFGFLEGPAESLTENLKWIYEEAREKTRKKFAEAGAVSHLRIHEDVAALSVGYDFFLQFLFDYGCIAEEEKMMGKAEFESVIFELAKKQNDAVQEEKPVYKFIKKLHSLIESGKYCLANKNGETDVLPPNCLGYCDDANYYLFKSQAHSAVRKLCEEQGESFTISEKALMKALAADRLINTEAKQFSKNVRIGKTTKRLVEMPVKVVLDIVNEKPYCVSSK